MEVSVGPELNTSVPISSASNSRVPNSSVAASSSISVARCAAAFRGMGTLNAGRDSSAAALSTAERNSPASVKRSSGLREVAWATRASKSGGTPSMRVLGAGTSLLRRLNACATWVSPVKGISPVSSS